MPTLRIFRVPGLDVWQAVIPNVGVEVTFVLPEDVQALANAMQAGQAEVLDRLPVLFEEVEDFGGAEGLFDLIFACDAMQFGVGGPILMTTVEGETIADQLLAFGEWLAGFFLAADLRKLKMQLRDKQLSVLGHLNKPEGVKGQQDDKKPDVTKSKAVVAAVKALESATAPDFGQTWTNFSKDSFALQDWGCTLDSVLGTIITQPSETLTGSESLTWSQTLSSIASGLTDGWIIWKTPSGRTFGVNIHVPLQIGPFGTAPYYQVQVDGGGWQGSYTSDVYTFDQSLGYKIQVRPTAGHSNIFLDITISNLPA